MKYDKISPGVRDLVRELNEKGYETTDSGDGTHFDEGMEGSLDCRHVFGIVPADADLERFTRKLAEDYPRARVEVSYSPGEPKLWFLYPDGDPD